VINSTELRLAAFAMEPIGTLLVGVSDGGENASGASAEARQERRLSFAPWRRG
jgi:predicted HTH transcriptional regulator